MTQRDKELLLKDLCGRLPYGVICECYHTEFDEWDGKPFVANYNETLINIDVNGFFLAGGFSYEIDEIKPYLRPMSSMTEEEYKEYTEKLKGVFYGSLLDNALLIDWLNEKMFDYRGLIPKDIAISTEEYNPYKLEE